MRNLYLFFRKHYFYFLFLLLEVVSLSLLFNYNEFQNAAVYTCFEPAIRVRKQHVQKYFRIFFPPEDQPHADRRDRKAPVADARGILQS